MSKETIADRVQWLLDSQGLTVNAAAKHPRCRVPQRTLARIVNGQSAHPRADAIKGLAKFFHVTPQWLLSGDPSEMSPSLVARRKANEEARGRFIDWPEIVAALELPDSVARAVLALPDAGARAAQLLASELAPERGRDAPHPLAVHAYLEECGAWIVWMKRAIQQVGREAMREWLIRHEDDVRRRFAVVHSPEAHNASRSR